MDGGMTMMAVLSYSKRQDLRNSVELVLFGEKISCLRSLDRFGHLEAPLYDVPCSTLHNTVSCWIF